MDDNQDVLIFDEEEGKPAPEAEQEVTEQPEAETAEAEAESEGDEESRPGAKALSAEEKLKRRNASLRRTRAENARKDRELADMREQLGRLTHSTQILTAAQVNATAAEADEEIRQGQELRRKAFQDGNLDLIDKADELIFQARLKKQNIGALRQQRPAQQQQQRQAPQAGPNPAREAWLAKNPWFNEDPVRRATVVAASNAAAAEGYDIYSKDHFDRIDEAIGNTSSRRKPPPMTPGVTRGGPAAKPGVIAVPRDVYNEWDKAGIFDGLSDAEKKAKLQNLGKSYQESVAKRQQHQRRA